MVKFKQFMETSAIPPWIVSNMLYVVAFYAGFNYAYRGGGVEQLIIACASGGLGGYYFREFLTRTIKKFNR